MPDMKYVRSGAYAGGYQERVHLGGYGTKNRKLSVCKNIKLLTFESFYFGLSTNNENTKHSMQLQNYFGPIMFIRLCCLTVRST